MNHATRVLAFPASVAVVMALTGCHGIDINDPLVRMCRDDTTRTVTTYPNGWTVTVRVVVEDTRRTCRKAA